MVFLPITDMYHAVHLLLPSSSVLHGVYCVAHKQSGCAVLIEIRNSLILHALPRVDTRRDESRMRRLNLERMWRVAYDDAIGESSQTLD